MSNFIADYVAICHTFNLNDVATRRNIEQYIAPRLQQIRRELTEALWTQRASSRPVPRDDRRMMLKEVQQYAASVRTALTRIRQFESAQPSVQ